MFNFILNLLAGVGRYALLVYETFVLMVTRPPKWSLVKEQLYRIGVGSSPVIILSGLTIGMVLAAQSFFQLSDKGLTAATGIMVTKTMIVEMGPILTAFMVTGRVGASMCAELGSMRVTEQLDALKSMAVNPISYLVAPRFIAGIIMLPLLYIFSALAGILGAYFLSVHYYHMSPTSWLDPLPVNITDFDLLSGFIKALFFGMIIVSVSCYRGINTRGGAEGVGRSTTRSVVTCYIIILISDFFLTVTLNAAYPAIRGLFA